MEGLMRTLLKYLPGAPTGFQLVAKRPIEHVKGAKELMRVNLGDPIPPGVILGKGTVITIAPKREPSTYEQGGI